MLSPLSKVEPIPLPDLPLVVVGFVSPDFSILFLISNRWMLVLLDVQAIRLLDGWNTMLVINAFPDPLLSSYRGSPSSVLNILITVPFIDAVANKFPSEFNVSAPISYSCAYIFDSVLLSLTNKRFTIKLYAYNS